MPHDDDGKPDIVEQLSTILGGLPDKPELIGMLRSDFKDIAMVGPGAGMETFPHPAYYDIDAIHADGTDPAGSATTIQEIYKSLMILDGVPASLQSIMGGAGDDAPGRSGKKLEKEALAHGFTDVDLYKSHLKNKAKNKVLKRTTVLGSVLISMFKALLYYFRDDINEIIRDYLRGESDISRRGRKLTNFEVLFKEEIGRTEATGTRERSYLAALIQFETDPRFAGIGSGDGHEGAEPGGEGVFDFDDLR